jgi:putative transposase
VSSTAAGQRAQLPEIKEVRPEYRDSPSQVVQDVLTRVDRTFQAFFRRVKAGETAGYPRFKSTTRYGRCTYKHFGNGATLDNGLLVLAKRGRLAVRWSRPLKGTPKTVTISREADGWYAGSSCAEVPIAPLPLTGCKPGIDVGLQVFLVRADGEPVENPRHYRRAERPLRRAQRRVSRRKKGRTRRRKAVASLKRRHQHVLRQRRDFQHKTALTWVREYDRISLDDLQIRNMVRRPEAMPDGNGGYLKNGASRKAGLNTSIHDAGWNAFRQILACKAAWAGTRVEAIPPASTSQDCSGCGERGEKSLSLRTHVCPRCGLVRDRDENAALNILRAGQARQARTPPVGPYVA